MKGKNSSSWEEGVEISNIKPPAASDRAAGFCRPEIR